MPPGTCRRGTPACPAAPYQTSSPRRAAGSTQAPLGTVGVDSRGGEPMIFPSRRRRAQGECGCTGLFQRPASLQLCNPMGGPRNFTKRRPYIPFLRSYLISFFSPRYSLETHSKIAHFQQGECLCWYKKRTGYRVHG